MERILTPKQREHLRQRHRKERDRRVCDRIKAVLAFDDGYSYTEIAQILLLDDETIRRHVEDYLKESKLVTNNGGSEGKLNDSETQKLVAHLAEVTYLHVKEICQYVRLEFGIKYSISGMTKWLHTNGFRHKKPHGRPVLADAEKQKKFITFYRRLKSKSKGKEPIYFADSVHPHYQTQLAYGWILEGERKEVKTTSCRKQLNFIGGISLDGHRFTFHQADWVNADSICDFLWKLRKANPGKYYVHLILDNAKYHHGNQVKEFAKELGIKLHYLPPYSPNLNPVERMWKLMHERVRYNKYHSTFSDFTDATVGFFKNIGRQKKILRDRITDNFQIMQPA